MLLTLLDALPTPGCYAIDDDGTVWLQFAGGRWGRGCLSVDGERHVFLRPAWAVAWAPLRFPDFLSRQTTNERRAS